MGDTLTSDAQGLALGMAIYPVAYATGAVLLRKARRGSARMPTAHETRRYAKRVARHELKRERRRRSTRR